MNRDIAGPADFRAATGVSRETLERLELYAALLLKWQKRINLVAPKTLPIVWQRHFFDSAQLLPLLPPHARTLADLGSGAGFPGLVLALCQSDSLHVSLYESDSRKSEFLRTVIRQTHAPAAVCEGRIETLAAQGPDIVTARALAPLPNLLPLVERFWRPGITALLLKGRSAAEEIEACSKSWDLDYHLVPSETDSAGSILVIRSLARVRALPE
jgi:16S rRNA (guanine527-N7)-methyltransferase